MIDWPAVRSVGSSELVLEENIRACLLEPLCNILRNRGRTTWRRPMSIQQSNRVEALGVGKPIPRVESRRQSAASERRSAVASPSPWQSAAEGTLAPTFPKTNDGKIVREECEPL